jgi:hypothetical protein
MIIGRPAPPVWFPEPQLAQHASDLSPTEPAGQHLSPVEEHDRDPVAEFGCKARVVRIDDLEVPTLPDDPVRYERKSLGADGAGAAGDEADRPHQRDNSARVETASTSGNVRRLMRPVTALTIVFLLLLLTVAGIVFVIQLLSVS